MFWISFAQRFLLCLTLCFTCSHGLLFAPRRGVIVKTTLSVAAGQKLPPTSGDSELLRDKLSVLQDVVHELHQREKQQEEASAATENDLNSLILKLREEIEHQKAREIKHEQIIEYLRGCIDSDKQQQEAEKQLIKFTFTEKLDDKEKITDTLDRNLKDLQRKSQEQLSTLQENLEKKEGEILSLNSKLSALKNQHDSDISKLNEITRGRELQTEELANLRIKLKDAQHRVQEYDKANQQLQAEVEEKCKEMAADEERVEIAVAAVQAAKKRAEEADKELERSEIRLKQLHLMAKIQQLALRALETSESEDERREEEKNRILETELRNCEIKVAELQSLHNKRSRFSWRGLGVFFKKKDEKE